MKAHMEYMCEYMCDEWKIVLDLAITYNFFKLIIFLIYQQSGMDF